MNNTPNLINQYPELSILFINFIIILIAYFYLYPKFVKDDISKLWKYDVFVSFFALFLAGLLFWGSGIEFSLIFFDVNWLVFSLLSFALIEGFFFFKYAKQQNINLSLSPKNFEKTKQKEIINNDEISNNTINKEPIHTYTDESKEGFIYRLHNFEKLEKLFVKNLTPNKDNSAEIFFIEVAKEFIEGLQKIDFEKYKNFDDKESFIEVNGEGQVRIYLAHKENLSTRLNGIEISTSHEITINFFGEMHEYYVAIGNKFFFDEKWKDDERVDIAKEEKWEYSEISDAIRAVESRMKYPTKILKVSWNNNSIADGIWDREVKRYHIIKHFRPIVFLKKLFIFWIKKEEKIVYVDWKPKVENQTTITKKEILGKLKNFLEQKISRKELADWAKNIDTLFDKQKIKYEYYEIDDTIYATMEAEAGIDKLTKKIKESKDKSLTQEALISFEEEDYNLQKDEVEKMIKWLEKLK